jgi:glycosyltransferase involved in cell wall biosynthesis
MKKSKPKVSIITIVYNGVNEIDNTIKSVIEQSYENIEYIIIDGNSDDGTQNVIKKYQNKIDYWISEPDKGVYDAMNKGIKYATGEWICFMNSGDKFYDKNVIEHIFNKSYSYLINVIYGDVFVITKNECFIKRAEQLVTIKKRLPFSHQSSFVRTSVMRNNLFNTEFKICADYDFFYNLYRTDNLQFQYIPLTVASFDAVGGISSSNPMLSYKETARSRGENGTLYWVMKFNIYRFLFATKQVIRKLGLIK